METTVGRFQAMTREELRAFLNGIGKTLIDGRPVAASRTAFAAAFMRAYHSANENPKVFDDWMAARMLTPDEVAFFEELYYRVALRNAPGDAALRADRKAALAAAMRRSQVADVLGRARFAEDCLERAVAEGIRQYVILGAGFDTFALRRPDLLAGISTIEVDHPSTQAVKRLRLAAMGLTLPSSLHFIPVDFSREDLAGALAGSCYNAEVPSFFSWLGVTYYLERRDIFNLLLGLGRTAAPGSMIAFDYLHAKAFDADAAAPQMKDLQRRLSSLGEPLKTGLDPAALGRDLAETRWQLKLNHSPNEIHETYFRQCATPLRTGKYLHLALAALPGKPDGGATL